VWEEKTDPVSVGEEEVIFDSSIMCPQETKSDSKVFPSVFRIGSHHEHDGTF
jgi:hypothetical protein